MIHLFIDITVRKNLPKKKKNEKKNISFMGCLFLQLDVFFICSLISLIKFSFLRQKRIVPKHQLFAGGQKL